MHGVAGAGPAAQATPLRVERRLLMLPLLHAGLEHALPAPPFHPQPLQRRCRPLAHPCAWRSEWPPGGCRRAAACRRAAVPAGWLGLLLADQPERSSPPAPRRPACRLFIANSLCCQGYGIVQHASVRAWLVCSADVHLPAAKCLQGETLRARLPGPLAARRCLAPALRVGAALTACGPRASPALQSRPAPAAR